MALCVTTVIRAEPRSQFPGLDAYVESALPDWQVPGMAIGVVKDGKVVLAKGYGVRQAGRTARIDAHTLFQIASLTKAFTGAAAGRLVEERKLDWDDLVIDHLPAFRLSDEWVTQHVTVRDMLGNRVGVESGGFSVTLQDQKEVVRHGRFAPFTVPFRHYQYSNYMYGVAGQLIAAVAGERYEEYLQRVIFRPLGMRESGTSPYEYWDAEDIDPCFFCERPGRPAGFEKARPQNVALAHWPTPAGPEVIRWRSMDGVAASGGIVSNLSDMLKWTQFNLAQGAVQGRQVLSPATVEELHRRQVIKDDSAWGRTVWPAVKRVAPNDGDSGYAMGWFHNTYRNRAYISHGGGALGMVTFVVLVPAMSTGVVILTNGNSAELCFAISFRVIDSLLNLPAHDWNADLLQEARAHRQKEEQERAQTLSRRLPGTKPTLSLPAYAGDYQSSIYGAMRIEVEGEKLVFRMAGQDSFSRPLEHWHGDMFLMPWWKREMQAFIAFTVNENATVTGFDAGRFFGRFERVVSR
jgi:CubicO group peptidase (beta-lactamase class C family)